MAFPEIILGGGSISAQYNTDVHLNSDIPLRTVRLALRCVRSRVDLDAFSDSIR
jgi:D-arabinose 1-dehydrogenase